MVGGRGLEWVPALDKVPGGFLPVGGGLQGTKSFYSELQTFLTFVSWTRLSIWTSSQTVNIWPRQTEMNTNQAALGSWFAQKVWLLWQFLSKHSWEWKFSSSSPSSTSFFFSSAPWIVIRIWLWADPFLSVPVLYRNWPNPPHINPSTHKSFRSVIRLIWRQIDWES